jgi:hypothetical protein
MRADDDKLGVFRIRRIQEGVFDFDEKGTRRKNYFGNYVESKNEDDAAVKSIVGVSSSLGKGRGN